MHAFIECVHVPTYMYVRTTLYIFSHYLRKDNRTMLGILIVKFMVVVSITTQLCICTCVTTIVGASLNMARTGIGQHMSIEVWLLLVFTHKLSIVQYQDKCTCS